jgi:hypothetical protein
MGTETITKCDICGKACKCDYWGYKETEFSKEYFGMFGYGSPLIKEKKVVFCNDCDYNFRAGVKNGFVETLKLQAEKKEVEKELRLAETKLSLIKNVLNKKE